MKKTILGLTMFGALFIGTTGIASADRISHYPRERHMFAEEIKEDIRELRDLVHDLREVLHEIRTNR